MVLIFLLKFVTPDAGSGVKCDRLVTPLILDFKVILKMDTCLYAIPVALTPIRCQV